MAQPAGFSNASGLPRKYMLSSGVLTKSTGGVVVAHDTLREAVRSSDEGVDERRSTRVDPHVVAGALHGHVVLSRLLLANLGDRWRGVVEQFGQRNVIVEGGSDLLRLPFAGRRRQLANHRENRRVAALESVDECGCVAPLERILRQTLRAPQLKEDQLRVVRD